MTPSMAHTLIAEATTSSTIENNAQKKIHKSLQPLREIMAPQRRSGGTTNRHQKRRGIYDKKQ
jgi:hypothetical protein